VNRFWRPAVTQRCPSVPTCSIQMNRRQPQRPLDRALSSSEALRLGQWHPHRLSADASGDRHGAALSDPRPEEVIAQRCAEHRPARWSRERRLPTWEHASEEQLGICARSDREQGAAEPCGLLAVTTLYPAGQMQLEAAPPKGRNQRGSTMRTA
jgi:hypothetical protein